ncbi:hypothetical protein DRF62_03170 [Chryseobacterium piscium]|uniref:Lipoprotein n=1 Tax=Chryseobacterium piscium TaxID=333702 RepID=A0A3D9BSS0_9FLAO|nr:hypothetical protein [Chryseobacterium piscium]REC56569.1 hypothetical protein DRF62_03170 [Chryseobacterium piscium]
MKKNLLLRLCLILLVFLTIYSCRTDHLPEQEKYNNSSKFQLTSKRISLNESKHRSALVPELEKAEAAFKNSKTSVNGRVIDYGNGVSIDTNNVIYIENGPNYHTYTFHIKRENALPDDPVENLVLSPMTDGTYKEVLVSYHLTPAEKETLNNGGLIDTKGKTIITELTNGTYSPLAKGMTACGWTETYTIVGCSDIHNGVSTHNAGNVESWEGCKADRKPGLYMTMTYRCDFSGMTDDIGNPSNPGGSSGSSGGGSSTGESGSDNDNNDPGNNTSPCPNGGALTSPPTLTTDPGDGNCSGIPTQINLPDRTTPCEKTKALLEDPVVKAKIDSLEAQSKKTGDDKGEKAFLYTNDSGSSDIIEGEDHEVNLTGYSGYNGIYHNHTPYGTKMLAPNDIRALYRTIVYKMTPAVSPKEAFVGMVAYETCNCPPNNYIYHHYLLRFNGDISKTGAIANISEEEIEKLRDDYRKLRIDLLKIPSLRTGPSIVSELNAQGLEQLLFKTLEKMNIDPSQIILQKIEKNGTINNINLNSDGTTTPVPCPK